jgi:dipeptidyl aminopeptidase/acylaminoacyl peptidase
MKSRRDGMALWVAALALALCVQDYSLGGPGASPAAPQTGAGGEPNLSFQVGHAVLIFSAALSPDMRLVLTGGDGGAALWEASSGREIRRFAGDGGMVTSVAFSADQKTALTGSVDKSVRLWDVETGREIRRFVGHTREIVKAAFMPDGKSIVTGAQDDTVRVWEIATGKEIRRFGRKNSKLSSLAVSPDGGSILTANFDKSVRLFDAATGKETRLFQGHTDGVNAVAFSPGGRLAASGGEDGAVRVWEVATDSVVRQLASGAVNSLAFSPDGRSVLLGTGNFFGLGSNTARLFEADTGKEVQQYAGHAFDIMSVMFSPDGQRVLTASLDSTTRIWTKAGKETCRLSYQNDDTWVVIDPERKFFDTDDLDSVRGLQWVMPDDPLRPLPLEIFMRDYYEPRLLPRLIAGDRFKPVRALAELNRVQPEVRIVKTEAAPDASDAVAVTVEVARAEGRFNVGGREVTRETGVYDLRLFRDGQMVGYEPRAAASVPDGAQGGEEELQSWRKATEVRLDASGKATRTFLVRLPHAQSVKQVEFSAYAFNADRVKSATDRRTYQFAASPAKGRAYLITFGVNTYESPQVSSLLYPANDARSIRDTLSPMLQQSYAEVVAVPLIAELRSRAGETVVQPTKENLKVILELLSGKEVAPERLLSIPAEIRQRLRAATPDDLVLISFSTHGEADGRGNFYLYPHDTGSAGDGAELFRHCISSEELSEWLRDVDAGEMVMILDACHSGAAPGADFKPGPMGSRGLGQLAYDKGMRLLAGTQADNVALGSGESLSGLLTTALVRDGLEKGEAARGGKITMTDWLGYAVRRVPVLYAAEIPKDQQQVVQQPALFNFGRSRNTVILAPKR